MDRENNTELGKYLKTVELCSGKQCILCGKCLEVCPLFEATSQEEISPRSKYFLLQELFAKKRELSQNKVKHLTGICLRCGRCADICPQNLDVPRAVIELKSAFPGWRARIWGKLIKNLHIVYPLLYRWAKRIQKDAAGKASAFGDFNQEQILPGWKLRKIRPLGQQKNAVLFPGCLARYGAVQWKHKAEKILIHADYHLLSMPDWHCCGFAISRAGLLDEAVQLQQQNLDIWRSLNRPYIFVLCSTCLQGLRDMVEMNLDWQGEEDVWLDSLLSVSCLLDYCEIRSLSTNRPERIYLHKPCHVHNQEWNIWYRTGVLAQGDTNELDKCCGFGGCMQLESPETTKMLGRRYWNSLEIQDGRQLLITECSGCILQLSRYKPANFQVSHWLDAFALDTENPEPIRNNSGDIGYV